MSSNEMINAERTVRRGQTIRVVIWLVVVAALVVFGVANREKVDIDWVVNSATAPIWAVIGVSALAGAIVGYVAHPRHN